MAQSKEKSGRIQPATSETGAITAKKASVFNIIKMETNTKECGPSIRSTAKEHNGETTLESLDVNTLETGMKTDATAVEHSFIPTEIVTTDTG